MEDRPLSGKCTLNGIPSNQNHQEPNRPPSRLIPRICWVISGLAILVSLGWIAFAEDKGTGMNAGVTAVPGTSIYQITDAGLALQATLQGTKFWADEDLN